MKKQNRARGIADGNSRRQFLKLAGYGTLGLITDGELLERPVYRQHALLSHSEEKSTSAITH